MQDSFLEERLEYFQLWLHTIQYLPDGIVTDRQWIEMAKLAKTLDDTANDLVKLCKKIELACIENNKK